jgi:hypothetical protein
MSDINKISVELATDMASLEKAMPPKLLYRLRALARKYRWSLGRDRTKQTISDTLKQKGQSPQLKKNEVCTAVYSDQSVRLDFGSDISDDVKKRAIEWCRKKGLVAIEASLAKSYGAGSYVLFTKEGKSQSQDAEIIDSMRVEIA